MVKAVVDITTDEEINVTDAVGNWAKAWSSQNVDKYLASYADSFKRQKMKVVKLGKCNVVNASARPSIGLELANQKVTLVNSDNAKVILTSLNKGASSAIPTDKT